MIVERKISVKNQTVHLFLLDMTKVFDSINRKLLIENRINIDLDELHLIKILLDVKLSVKCVCSTCESSQIQAPPKGIMHLVRKQNFPKN